MLIALLFRLTRYWTGPSTPQTLSSDLSESSKRRLRSVA